MSRSLDKPAASLPGPQRARRGTSTKATENILLRDETPEGDISRRQRNQGAIIEV